MQITELNQLEIKFETADILPPPFSHQILLTLDFKNDFIDTKFEIAYTYRDEISDEEILDEGFTGDEDLAWAGELSNAWKPAVLSILKETPDRPNQKALAEEQNFLEISINGNVLGNPKNQESWEYFLNELMQAVYETYGKELPFTVTFKKIESNKLTSIFGLTLHYTDRRVEAYTDIDNLRNSRSISWEEAGELIGQIFIGDFIQEKALKKEPHSVGKFISIGDGLWYEFTKSVKNPNGNKMYITSLYQRFEEYF